MSGVTLAADDARLTIAAAGAEARAWSVGGLELLWPGDPAIWNQISPILFPVVGWTRDGARVGGKQYALGLHGFAAKHDFSIETQGANFARFALRDNVETRAIYPFAFALAVEYRLTPDAFTMTIEVENPGDAPAPYACGTHPGFRWPFAGGAMEDYAILFGEAERAEVPVISSEGLLTRKHRPVPLDGRRLVLSPGLMEREALCFLEARSRSLRFAHRSGAAIEVALENFPHLALWSRPAGGFLSIEAWTGHGDFVDADGDLFAKPSMIHLAPGASATHAATFAFV